jgi:Flp pilus assembly protein TadG
MDMRIGSRTAASPGVRFDARGGRKRAAARARHERGQAVLEFALVLPVLAVLLLGIIVFGIALNNYLELTNAATAGAQALSISRGQTTDPCLTVTGPAFAAASNLTPSKLLFTIQTSPPAGTLAALPGASNTASPSCPASTSTLATELQEGGTAQVTITYPCNLTVFGVKYGSTTCLLTGQTAENIQ